MRFVIKKKEKKRKKKKKKKKRQFLIIRISCNKAVSLLCCVAV